MKRIFYLTTIVSALLTACTSWEAGHQLKRIVFDAGDLNFISTSFNPGKETMAALYGNQEAVSLLSEENKQSDAKAEFKLATFKYHENPQYIGGTITGELISVETLQADKEGNLFYHYRDSSGSEKGPLPKEERIKYILGYKPVNRP
ncbi:hypothetical protein U0035_09500 [Niabella yanshanensis]|uniref:Lipoprotein n=1 Tax=Niabella yanshanensis TaxID=577386 RepID=A0ABZ0WCE1_9BACT|nr:hypothetical protein [Niabella yanshanensis]WQD40379.1 hypothetical protein U0035_09500 [Niabella yanshanensis]